MAFRIISKIILWISFAASIPTGLVAAGGVASKSLRSPGRLAAPPLLLITLDTVRADHLGCYGYPEAETPSLDSLARDSVRFANAYTVAPMTLPAHAVILTGTYPMWSGVRDFTSSGLPTSVPTLAEILKRHGYSTAAFVSAYVLNSMWGLNRGFDAYDDQMPPAAGTAGDPLLVTRAGDLTTSRMLSWLDGHAQQPFFVWLHLYDAHSPYRSPEPYRSRHAADSYDGAIAFDDAQVGRVLAALRSKGLYDRTLIVVTSDHGESLGEHGEAEHGFFIYNATLHVPLIVKWPEDHEGGRVATEPASIIDIPSTVAKAAGIPEAELGRFQGKSLARGAERAPASRATATLAYAESYYARDSFGWHELRAMVTQRYKYIDAPEPELYDLEQDPTELSNIAGTHKLLADSLKAQLGGLERQFGGGATPNRQVALDSETLEKLKSLGYLAYKAEPQVGSQAEALADPKQKIATFNEILHAGDLRRAGEYAAAAHILSALREREPKLYVVPFEAGENDLAWSKPKAATEEFRAALQINPTFDQALLGLGRAHSQLGQDNEAATAIELALHLNPHNFLARLGLAQLYIRANSFEKAEAELRRVVSEQPGFAEGHAEYGVILARRKKYPEAEREIERGLELGYQDAVTFNFLGIARGEAGQSKAAIEAYQQALKLDPRYSAAYLNLAIEYRRLEEPAEARRYYQKVCELSDTLCRQYAFQFQTH